MRDAAYFFIFSYAAPRDLTHFFYILMPVDYDLLRTPTVQH